VASEFDVVGVGLNATDTLLVVPHFPAYAGKVAFEEEIVSPGGQVASAMAACARLGLRAKYIGSGRRRRARARPDGQPARLGHQSGPRAAPRGLRQSIGLHRHRPGTGERTVFWSRPECLRIDPAEIAPEQILCARLLHIDGHDTAAVAHAARIAHGAGIPVTVDVDTIYHGFDRVLPYVDYLIASSEFPAQWTNEPDPFRALETIQREYGMRVAAMTLGAHGALALENGRFVFAGFRGELRGYHRRRRRVSRRLLLFCFAGYESGRRSRFFQRHGSPQLHGAGRARRALAASRKYAP
jgi:sulfofructose kinase